MTIAKTNSNFKVFKMNDTRAIEIALPIIIAEIKEGFINNLPPYLTILERSERVSALNLSCAKLKKVPTSYFCDV